MSVIALEDRAARTAGDRPQDPVEARRLMRTGAFTGPTDGVARGYVQANLCILPKDYADEFLSFCQRNPKPCPLLASSDPGSPRLPTLAEDLDIRTDVTSYRVFRDGEMVEDVPDIKDLWQDDFVIFALGCSFSFEEALIEAGLPLRYWESGATVPMYLTGVDTVPAGRFSGKMVVSMRPYTPANAIRAIQITSRFPNVHGAPIHVGMPHLIGIPDINDQWQGGDPDVRDDELPVFWACGVTPQSVVAAAKPPICITHTPAHMLITDKRNASLAIM